MATFGKLYTGPGGNWTSRLVIMCGFTATSSSNIKILNSATLPVDATVTKLSLHGYPNDVDCTLKMALCTMPSGSPGTVVNGWTTGTFVLGLGAGAEADFDFTYSSPQSFTAGTYGFCVIGTQADVDPQYLDFTIMYETATTPDWETTASFLYSANPTDVSSAGMSSATEAYAGWATYSPSSSTPKYYFPTQAVRYTNLR